MEYSDSVTQLQTQLTRISAIMTDGVGELGSKASNYIDPTEAIDTINSLTQKLQSIESDQNDQQHTNEQKNNIINEIQVLKQRLQHQHEMELLAQKKSSEFVQQCFNFEKTVYKLDTSLDTQTKQKQNQQIKELNEQNIEQAKQFIDTINEAEECLKDVIEALKVGVDQLMQ